MTYTERRSRKSTEPVLLIVDDEDDILPEYQDFFDLEGFPSLLCARPELAVHMVLENPGLRLVITDLRMARLDGLSLIRQLRTALPAQRRLDFIILTGDASSQIGEDLADIPVLFKPADTDALLEQVKAMLP